MIRDFVQSTVATVQPFPSFYSCGASLLSTMFWKSRNSFTALKILCDAQRRIRDIAITKQYPALVRTIIENQCYSGGELLPIRQNGLLRDFYSSRSYALARSVFAKETELDRLHLRHYRPDGNPSRQGNMIILKRPVAYTGEKGVILLKYTPTFEAFATIFDLASLLKDYRIVFEPSSYRNVEPSLFLFTGVGQIHLFQSPHHDDRNLLRRIKNHCLRTIDIGSGDWVDDQVFRPTNNEKAYDVVMVASWLKQKRHSLLFKALRKLKEEGTELKAALVGYKMDLSMEEVEDLARKHGVIDNCAFFQNLDPSEVAKIVASSRVAVHLSKAEGPNKACYEAMMCNVPLIVYKGNIGFRNDYINNMTGVLADDKDLAGAIVDVLRDEQNFKPREWLSSRSGYRLSTIKLNKELKSIAIEQGEPWTVDVVEKKNSPNLVYANENDRVLMEPAYMDLHNHLLPWNETSDRKAGNNLQMGPRYRRWKL